MAASELTFEEFKDAMVVYAKAVQKESYIGDQYYLENDEDWATYFNDNKTPEESVREDMEYWNS